jgi:transposase
VVPAPGQTQVATSFPSEKKPEEVAQFQAPLSAQLHAQVTRAQQRGYRHWHLWSQDESRCGLLPIVRHRITARGVQPVLSAAYHFESVYVYGAVEPLSGQSFFLELPALNTEGFQLLLDHFAAADPTSFHRLLFDNGAFHKAHTLRLPQNVALLFFPPYAPDLNSIERLWCDLKDWLAQAQPATLDDLSTLLMTRLPYYSAAVVRSLTGFSYLLAAAQTVNG